MSDTPRVMICVPAYAQMRPETAFCLAQTYLRLAMDGPTFIAGVFDCPSVGHARARLIAQFMASDCTHALMLDADMCFNVEAPIRLLEHNVPFVGVPGPDKRTGGMYVGKPGHGSGEKVQLKYDIETGLLKVDRIGACFMLIRRDCIERLMEVYPELHLKHQEIEEKQRKWYYAFFETKAENGWWPTEDYYFCDLLRGAGIPVLADAWVEMTHIVPQKITGKLINSLEF